MKVNLFKKEERNAAYEIAAENSGWIPVTIMKPLSGIDTVVTVKLASGSKVIRLAFMDNKSNWFYSNNGAKANVLAWSPLGPWEE